VYRTTSLKLKVQRALKILRTDTPGLGSSDIRRFRDRFDLEVQLGLKLNDPTPHPNLIVVYNFEQEEDLFLLEMEYAPGGSLADLLEKYRQGLEVERAVQIAIDLAQRAALVPGRARPGGQRLPLGP
jgi:serine/threonine protein kinase